MKRPIPKARPLSELDPLSAYASLNDKFAQGAGHGDAPAAAGTARSAASPRPVIRGESAKRGARTLIDWLRFTFLPVGAPAHVLDQLNRYFKLVFSIPINILPSKRGFRGYEQSHDIMAWLDGEMVRLGIIAIGGEHVGGTMLVDISGTGCGVISDWPAVHAVLQDLDARITRCDLALDFPAGEVTIEQVEQMYFAGDFNAGGRIPKYTRHQSGYAGGEGLGGTTFEIGRRANGKMLRAYEKGRQLGSQQSPWVRVEIEFGNKDRVIPHDIILRTDDYFVGAYKALEQFLDASAAKCITDQYHYQITIERALAALREQRGKSIHVLADHFGNDAAFVQAVRVRGTPAHMQKTALARHVWGAHDPAPIYQE